MDFQPIVDYIEEYFRSEKGIPSCDIRIMQDHKELFRYHSGHSDADGKNDINGDELYDLYSCTKPMTCTAALQLVEKGVIGLDEPVYKYLHEYKNAFVIKNGKAVTVGEKMTIRQLFMMAGGLDYDLWKAPLRELIAKNPHAGTVELVNTFVKVPLFDEPGQRFNYSLCHDVLAAVVEVASGKRFSEYLRDNIWEPLGMKRTSFGFKDDGKSTFCTRYCYANGKMEVDTNPNVYALTDNYESGGAGITTCVHDYSLFADAMACGGVGSSGNRIIKPETIDLMRTEQLSTHISIPEPLFEGYGYALGVRTLVNKSAGAKSPLGEFGWDGAAGSYILMDPENHLSIFFAMNVLGWFELMNGRTGHYGLRDRTYEILGL